MATKTSRKSTKRKSTSAGPRRTSAASASAPVTASKAATTPLAVLATSAGAPTSPSAALKPAPAKAEAAPAMAPEVAAPDDERLRRGDLIDAIAKRVSLKRSEAKMVFDVVLDEIGKALDGNDEIVVPPLGKLMVKKRMEKPNGAILTVKLKRAEVDPAAGDVPPLADVDKDR